MLIILVALGIFLLAGGYQLFNEIFWTVVRKFKSF